jgi:hypothetical protein
VSTILCVEQKHSESRTARTVSLGSGSFYLGGVFFGVGGGCVCVGGIEYFGRDSPNYRNISYLYNEHALSVLKNPEIFPVYHRRSASVNTNSRIRGEKNSPRSSKLI